MGRDLVAIARRVLMAVASGDPLHWEDVDALVDAVLQADAVVLAMAIREGGEHVVMRAVQLAGILAAGATRATRAEDSVVEGGRP